MSHTALDVWAPGFFEAVICAPTQKDNDDARRTAPSRGEAELATPTQRDGRTRTSINGIPTAELLAHIRAGHREALSILYRATFDHLWTIAAICTRSAVIAEEIVHDVFLRFWIRREQLDVDVDVGLYLTVAVRNRARDISKHDRIVNATASSIMHAAIDVPAFGQEIARADQQLEAAELRDSYHRAIGTLTEQERTAVLLRWDKGWTFEQMGEVLGISNVGARKVLLRAQRKVQALLADYRD